VTIALWITAVLLGLAYLATGLMKVVRSREQLEPQLLWVTDAATWQVKTIGVLEVLGSAGVLLPLATGIAPVLTAVAAFCLALIQVFAIPVHLRIHDRRAVPLNVVLLLLALVVAVLRLRTL